MNIAESEVSEIVVAKACGCKEKNMQKVTYAFSKEFHSLCIDKKDIIEAQIQACERLLKYTSDAFERLTVEKEIAELRIALDLLT